MADILIRGMEMPKSRGEYELRVYVDLDGTATAEGAYCRFDGEPFETVPIPEGHGRLIDADALDRAFTDLRFNSDGTLNHWGDRPGWCMHGYEVEKLIADAPTIVPAEGGDNNEHV